MNKSKIETYRIIKIAIILVIFSILQIKMCMSEIELNKSLDKLESLREQYKEGE